MLISKFGNNDVIDKIIDMEKEYDIILPSQQPRCKQRGIKQDTLQSSGVCDPRGSRQMRASSHLARCFTGINIKIFYVNIMGIYSENKN